MLHTSFFVPWARPPVPRSRGARTLGSIAKYPRHVAGSSSQDAIVCVPECGPEKSYTTLGQSQSSPSERTPQRPRPPPHLPIPPERGQLGARAPPPPPPAPEGPRAP